MMIELLYFGCKLGYAKAGPSNEMATIAQIDAFGTVVYLRPALNVVQSHAFILRRQHLDLYVEQLAAGFASDNALLQMIKYNGVKAACFYNADGILSLIRQRSAGDAGPSRIRSVDFMLHSS